MSDRIKTKYIKVRRGFEIVSYHYLLEAIFIENNKSQELKNKYKNN